MHPPKIIIAAYATLALTACANKYAGWEFVRLEQTVPTGCTYKMQEVCAQVGTRCLNWHKQRATLFDANTVVITGSTAQQQSSFSPWSGKFNQNFQGTTIAEYYKCSGEKNIAAHGIN
jgi:hypothetical protein